MDTTDRRRSAPATLRSLRIALQRLERGRDSWALRWQALLAFIDLSILAFFILGPYLRAGPSYLIIDYTIAAWIGAELIARAVAAPSPQAFLKRPMTWVDVIILATLLFPDLLFNFAFLRAMRIWAIGRSPLFRAGLRRIGGAHLQDVVRACLNFLVFLFMMTGFVYTTFFYAQEGGEGFVDALYFTVATVTTTGFGDITLPGTLGKLTSVVTMIIGISLFVRLAQAVVRPHKVNFPCPQCGLQRHDLDAVHCKACGHLLNIPDEGD
ncbi:ion transporter [Sinorhizobium fredii USDA 205]|uniref:Ion transporter n=1 Tax=Rhizobium fredii TaxID=380 RepID=A0A844AAU8_RHIFR|nr:potassium channel family protein [Sinorhizobium fredii]ASY73131.1 Potassium voltage-gated channel subfamily KQT [Sinorhizobium fredii CCBAU 83666]KSV86820.1 ion transporter [Sinorhizobium fredii USDA 205]MQX10093.1 ion transporter [Sinorhizobium fredii]GEC32365.1 ion transporter [Sinorhizobium fredii]GLS08870.1 ion transporter [Sinorhizobium fredii]